jgi:hypothetical protein
MKHTIKILSVLLLGLIAFLPSCEKQNQYPDTEKKDFIHFYRVAGFETVASTTPLTNTITMGAKLHWAGGNEFEKIEIHVVKNRTSAAPRVSGLLTTINKGQLSLETAHEMAFTLQQILDATGGGAVIAGNTYSFYYTVYMPGNKVFPGWTALTQFTTTDLVSIPVVPGQTAMTGSNYSFSAVCGLNVDDFLGNWTVSAGHHVGWGETWPAVVTLDPASTPNTSIFVFTVTGIGNIDADETPAWDFPVKVIVNWNNYTWSTEGRQRIFTVWPANPAYFYEIDRIPATALNSCASNPYEFRATGVFMYATATGGWSNLPVVFTKDTP